MRKSKEQMKICLKKLPDTGLILMIKIINKFTQFP